MEEESIFEKKKKKKKEKKMGRKKARTHRPVMEIFSNKISHNSNMDKVTSLFNNYPGTLTNKIFNKLTCVLVRHIKYAIGVMVGIKLRLNIRYFSHQLLFIQILP